MKKALFTLVLIFASALHLQSSEPVKYDYLSSNYYIRMANATLDYLKGNYKCAYDTLICLENDIPLLNTPEYDEMRTFLELSLMYENYDKAYKYLIVLIEDYGYKAKFFNDFKNIKKLRKQKIYDSKKIKYLEKNFVSDTAIVHTIEAMREREQFFRRLPIKTDTFPKLQCGDTSWRHPYAKQFDSIDKINYKILIQLIHQNGFPLSKNMKYMFMDRITVYRCIMPILMHINDSSWFEEMKSVLIENIRNGDCPPQLLGNMVDRHYLSTKKFIYGIYNNTSKEQIFDLPNLDKRRAEIGLPPHKVKCEIENLFHKKYFSQSNISVENCDF
ncbi:MAG: hypothetical protein LBC68_04190 [Prevotellaceae bacterium]|jgi:hypothetical protein|nr:hypothetical protein [Prevotellaceae bacterium]